MLKYMFGRLFVLALLGCCISTAAFGQRAGVLEREIEAKGAELTRKRPRLDLPEPGEQPPKGGTQKLFVLKEVRLDGVHSLRPDEVAPAYREYLGRPVLAADLSSITARIGNLYKERGYVLSRAFILPQDVNDGRLTIRVVEGHVAQIALEGLGPKWDMARATLDTITNERPSRLATIERQLLLLSDTPGVRIGDVSLTEIGNGSGRFLLTVKASFVPVLVALDANNRAAADIGPWQTFASIGFNSLFRAGDLVLLNFSTTPHGPEELSYGGAVLETQIGTSGVRAGLRVSFSEIQPNIGNHFTGSRTRTEEHSFYASSTPLRTRALSIRLTASVGAREVTENSSFGFTTKDHIRAIALSTEIQANDDLNGVNYLALAVRHGLPGVGASDWGDMDTTRPDASADFFKLTMSYSRLQPLWGPFTLLATASAQLSSGPLLQSEQFFVGGTSFGRAFSPGTFAGDSGIATLAELRFDQTVDNARLAGYQLYAFIDGAGLWTRGSELQQVSSYGAGVRFALRDDWRAGLEVARPIEVPTYASHPGTRVFFTFSHSFTGCRLAWCE